MQPKIKFIHLFIVTFIIINNSHSFQWLSDNGKPFIPLSKLQKKADSDNYLEDVPVVGYKIQEGNRKYIQMKPEIDWQVIFKYQRPLTTTETATSTSDNLQNYTSTTEESPTSTEDELYKKIVVVTKSPKGNVPYDMYPLSIYSDPKFIGKYLWLQANASENHRVKVAEDEKPSTTTTEEPSTTTTEEPSTTEMSTTTDYTTTEDTVEQADDDSSGKQENKPVVIGDVLSVQWANAICMTMINLVAAGVLWLGGELTWVGRANTIRSSTIHEWLSKGFEWDSLDHGQKLCSSRASCEAPKMALAYINAYEIVSFIFSYVSWLPPGGEYVKVAKKIASGGTTNKYHCMLLYPCLVFNTPK